MATEQKSDSQKQFAVVVGVGPGLGRSLAVRFAAANYNIVLVSRSGKSSAPIKEEINKLYKNVVVECVAADTTDENSVKTAFKDLESKKSTLGVCGVLCYNAGPHFQPKPVLESEVKAFNTALQVGCTGALIWSQAVLPGMLQRGQGSILMTGATASLRGGPKFQELACAKFALRALSQSMAREMWPKGIHVAHIIVDGLIWSPKTSGYTTEAKALNPDKMAEAYYQLHVQDKSVWTQELDLRPYCEEKW